jgi:hypothetical protein
MVGNGEGEQVLYTYTDRSCGTGDYYVVTKGGHWKWTMSPSLPATGDVRGQLRDGKVYR